MFRHENASQDSQFEFTPQLTQIHNLLLPKTLGVKQARAIPPCAILVVR